MPQDLFEMHGACADRIRSPLARHVLTETPGHSRVYVEANVSSAFSTRIIMGASLDQTSISCRDVPPDLFEVHSTCADRIRRPIARTRVDGSAGSWPGLRRGQRPVGISTWAIMGRASTKPP